MTTTVKIEAHCASSKQVVVTVEDGENTIAEVLQDGERREVYAYDARRIVVFEQDKAVVNACPVGS